MDQDTAMWKEGVRPLMEAQKGKTNILFERLFSSNKKINALTEVKEDQYLKEGTPATRAASFAFRPLLQLFQLSLQRPVRIRRTLFCMTDFTWECIAKGRFVGSRSRRT